MVEPICGCAICQHHHAFDVPDGLVEDIMAGRVAIFAGAGISTENSTVFKSSLYEGVAHQLGINNPSLPFPDLMQKYCQQRDGRLKLIKQLRDYFYHVKSFPELHRNATRFHRELSTLFPIDTIITTNWDTHFEDECHAVPFVTDEDMALWDAAERRVLKIHGSISNLGSIVATRDDYNRSKRSLEKGLIGGRLKEILSSKTILYVGYSYRDDDLAYINSYVSKQLGQLGKQAFIVSLDDGADAMDRYRKAGLHPIFTDASHFISELKKHAISSYCMISDDVYAHCASLLLEIEDAHDWLHEKYEARTLPEMSFCAFYQDGLMHAMERILKLRGSGRYSHLHYILHQIDAYFDLRKKYRSRKRYDDVAYIDGYRSGLIYAARCTEETDPDPPLFYAFGCGDLYTSQDFEEVSSSLPGLHRAASRRAQLIAQELAQAGEGLVMHHPPWL